MVTLSALWLPILGSAVIVFLASSVLHMLLPFHRGDYRQLKNEDKVLADLRAAGVTPGDYHFPYACDPKAVGTPEMAEKYKAGPVGILTVIPNGPPNMAKYLGSWMIYCVAICILTAYVATIAVGPGAEYLTVFRLVSVVAFLGFAGAQAQSSIWKGQAWGTTAIHIADSLIYAVLTAGVFSWLWP